MNRKDPADKRSYLSLSLGKDYYRDAEQGCQMKNASLHSPCYLADLTSERSHEIKRPFLELRTLELSERDVAVASHRERKKHDLGVRVKSIRGMKYSPHSGLIFASLHLNLVSNDLNFRGKYENMQ